MTENERIKQVRKSMNLTLETFGQRVGVTKAAISRVENGFRSVTDQMRRSICREFGVNEDWLLTGEGEMFVHAPSSDVGALAEKYRLTPEAQVMIERFIQLSPEIQKGILDYILDVAAVINGERPGQSKAEKLAQYAKELDEAEEAAERSSASQTSDGDTAKMA